MIPTIHTGFLHGYHTLFPGGMGAATMPIRAGYTMVSRWISPPEVKLWFENGGTFVPVRVGRDGQRVYVVPKSGQPPPAGLGRDQTIRLDFALPERALTKRGTEFFILQPIANSPIHNVSIHIPVTLNVEDVLRNRGI